MTRRDWPGWMRTNDILDLLKLSVPIAISRMSWMLIALTDAIVLGQGAASELPLILNAWLPIGVSLGLGMGILLGVQVLTSELMGQAKPGETGRIFRRGMVWAIALGVALMGLVYFGAEPLFKWIFIEISPNPSMSAQFSAEEIAEEITRVTQILSYGMIGFMAGTVCSYYLEALRKPLIVTLIAYIAVAVNVLLDCALVFGWWGLPQMGAEGVAWATTIGRWLVVILSLIFILKWTPALEPAPPAPKGEARHQFNVGIGTAISNVAEWGGFNTTYVIAAFISLAVNSIYGYTVQIMGICFMLFLGIGSATSVRVAENYGVKDIESVKDASRLGVAATLSMGFILACLIFALRDIIPLGLVNKEAEIDGVLLAPAIGALLIYAAIGTTLDGLQATASMALRAQNIIWLPSFIHITSFFAIMLPSGYWLGIVLERGAQGMMEAAVIGVGIAGIAQWTLLEFTLNGYSTRTIDKKIGAHVSHLE